MKNEEAALILGVIAEQKADIDSLRAEIKSRDEVMHKAALNYLEGLREQRELHADSIKRARLAISSQAERRKFDQIYQNTMKGDK